MPKLCLICGMEDDIENNIYFHSFPKKQQRASQWWSILTDSATVRKVGGQKICSRHFAPSSICGTRLTNIAVPLPWQLSDATDAVHHALDVPTVDVPAVKVPTVDVPAVKVPTVDVPAVKVPTVDVPAVKVPAVDVPVELNLPTIRSKQPTPDKDSQSQLNSESVGPTKPTTPEKTGKKRKAGSDSADLLLGLATEYFKRPDTEEDILAKGWAMKLKKITPDQRRFAEKIINDTLFEAAMGTLTRKGVCFLTHENKNSVVDDTRK